MSRFLLAAVLWGCPFASIAAAQVVSQRGFVEGSVAGFPQDAPNDTTRVMADVMAREEVFVRPNSWLQFAAGIDARANSHDQVDDQWTVDYWGRGERRPRLDVRRLSATMARGPFTVDLGKQFVRWGTTDIVNPTDRFAPRDFVNVVDPEFLGITAARAVTQLGRHTIDVVWATRFAPSRVPLADQRWAVVPPELGQLPVVHIPAALPSRAQVGIRWGHVIGSAAYSLSFFDGNNHQPDINASVRLEPSSTAPMSLLVPVALDVTRVYPAIRAYGGDLSVPLSWVTVKAEAAYVTSPTSDEYGLFVLQLERQSGEWVFVGGYAGEVVAQRRSTLTFAPDRGASRSIVGRVERTVYVNGRVAVEGGVRQNGHGVYARGEYSQTHGQHWETTASVVGLGGRQDDFFGQYRRNSHVRLSLRYSF